MMGEADFYLVPRVTQRKQSIQQPPYPAGTCSSPSTCIAHRHTMSLAARLPGARKSLSTTDLNTFDPSAGSGAGALDLAPPLKAKKRAYMSFGGEGLAGLTGQGGMPLSTSLESVRSQLGEADKGAELSPRRKARRALVSSPWFNLGVKLTGPATSQVDSQDTGEQQHVQRERR